MHYIEQSKDWEVKSSPMSNIYKFSVCNITATSAMDDTGGCYFSRGNYNWTGPLRLNFIDAAALSEPANGMSDSEISTPSRSNGSRAPCGKYELFEPEVEKSWKDDISCGAVKRQSLGISKSEFANYFLLFDSSC